MQKNLSRHNRHRLPGLSKTNEGCHQKYSRDGKRFKKRLSEKSLRDVNTLPHTLENMSKFSTKNKLRKTPIAKFTFLSVNIRSLNGNFHKLVDLINSLGFKPTVIGISETWITETSQFLYKLEGYDFLENNSNIRSGGCAIFIKSEMDFELIKDYSLNDPNTNELWLLINLSKGYKLVIGSLYRHPNYLFNEFEKGILSTLNKLNSKKMKFIIVGDVNINLFDTSSRKADFINTMSVMGVDKL